jgi:hypothetical protein
MLFSSLLSRSKAVRLSVVILGACAAACSSASEGGGAAGNADAAPPVAHDGGAARDAAPPPTQAQTCSRADDCQKWECTCNDPGAPVVDSSECLDGFCEDGTTTCTPICANHGGVESVKRAPWMPPPPPPQPDAGGPSACLGASDACSQCIAQSCCAESTACGKDASCVSTTLCMVQCTGFGPPFNDTFDACAAKCSPDADATFAMYDACIDAHGCAAKCGK